MAEQTVKITPASDKEINDLLNLGGANNVITPVEPTKDELDLNLSEESDEEGKPKKLPDPVLDLNLNEESEETKDKPIKDSELTVLEDLVKNEKIFLFTGDKALKDYSKKERIELVEANLERIRVETEEKTPSEFFQALPPELQYAAKYHFDGGKDFKSLFKYLAQSEEAKSLDISTEKGQEQTIRTYLGMLGDLSPEEIEEEVTALKDQPGALEKKASQYKPKVDAKQKQILDKEIKDQEARKVQYEEAAANYRENILNALKPAILDEIKITPDTQQKLFNGLTQAVYPSINGNKTNLLGHLIEKYSYVKPNPVLIAQALWLLDDPKGFIDAVKTAGEAGAAAKTFKELKTANQQKATSTTTDQEHIAPIKKTIQKKAPNIFSRPQPA